LGRAHALYLASQGARVLVNDLGGSVHGEGADPTAAQNVAEEIRQAGGAAAASSHDVADWHQAQDMINQAVRTFGGLHVLVNNAGILRDRTLVNMTEDEWDSVVRVHLKGHAAPTKFAMTYWRNQSKGGRAVKASVIHTSSIAGLSGNFGQANYSSAKLGVVALSRVVALEGARIGVRSNVVSPSGRTRLALSTPTTAQLAMPPSDNDTFDFLDPANVSPLIGWLAEESCPANCQVFHLGGNRLIVMKLPEIVYDLRANGRWTAEALDSELSSRLVDQIGLDRWLEMMRPI
jgi:NAD(P)-dependent dehydrogenase (short-subunit alcohol dehydrogenase family)